MTEQQTLEQIGRALEDLRSEMTALRAETKPLERPSAETLAAASAGAAETVITGVLYPLSQKLDEQPWDAVYSLHQKLDALRAETFTLSEKLDALLKAISLTEGVYKHVSDETDRLDGYLNYHVDQLKQAILLAGGRVDEVSGGQD